MLIDTHCHFNHEKMQHDLPDAVLRAQEEGVRQMLVVGYDLESSEQAVHLAHQYPSILFAAVGVHPHDSKDWNLETEERLRTLCADPVVVALGEIGLDFHYDFSPRGDQYTAFRSQMQLAREVKLPVIIHCREAYPETLSVLAEEKVAEVRGVMHCWAGSVEQALETTALGMMLGFGGTLTFKNAEEVRASASAVPLESILLETDAPYLAPVPHRGKRNEPAYVHLVAKKMAELLGVSLPEIAHHTTNNAHSLFPRMQIGL